MNPLDGPSTPRLGTTEESNSSSRNPSNSPTSSRFPSLELAKPLSPLSTSQQGSPSSSSRYASTSNAFGLTPISTSPSSPTTSSREFPFPKASLLSRSPPTAGTIASHKLRRPSLLSLTQNARSMGGESNTSSQHEEDKSDHQPAIDPLQTSTGFQSVQDPSSSKAPLQTALAQAEAETLSQQNTLNPFTARIPIQPTPRWSSTLFLSSVQRTSSAPPLAIEALSTNTPPLPREAEGIGTTRNSSMSSVFDMDDIEDTNADNPPSEPKSPLRWMPAHLQGKGSRRKGKAKVEDAEMQDSTSPPQPGQAAFTGRPLPASLVATLISESAPLEHEMRSEARLQRFIASHPQPFTPRASRSSRGRFPETFEDGDDDDDFLSYRNRGSLSWNRRSLTRTRASSSDSDSDDMMMEELQPEPVNSAFAAGMDMDRPGSSSSSASAFAASGAPTSRSGSGSGQGTQNQPTPPSNNSQWPKSSRMSIGNGAGLVPSPGVPTGLPFAFGGLGVGGTPQASPTIERLELATSPGTSSVASPGLMQYRESQAASATVRPGKRKPGNDDRFDPYKRPRASSPSLAGAVAAFPMSPSRSSNPMPIPQSPGHPPFLPSSLSTPSNGGPGPRQVRPGHPYTRPMSSRSRAASPALSIGSTSGVLSTSLGERGNNINGRPSLSLGQAFIPTGTGAPTGLQDGSPALGSLGLLSLSQMEHRQGSLCDEPIETIEEDTEGSRSFRSGMEEDRD